MNIKKIINFEIIKKDNETLQRKAIKALGYFLVLMVLFTLLSRFADTLTIPKVTTDTSKKMALSHNSSLEGEIVELKELSISTLDNIKVSYVAVNQGSSVKKGDVLVQLDIDDINEKIEEKNKEIQDKEKSVARAQEDYDIAVANEDKTIQEYLEQLNEAEKALNDYKNSKDKNKDEEVSEEDLKSAYDEKLKAYNDAVDSKDQNLLMNKRTLDDAIEEGNTDDLKSELEKLQALADAKGNVTATQDGVITNVLVASGDITSDAAILTMADKSAGYKLTAQVSKDEKKYYSKGQAISIQLTESGDIYDELTITSVAKNSQDSSMYDLTITLPSGVGEVGESAKIFAETGEKKYPICVPLEALHSESENNYYVLVMSEEETVLGTETVAAKVPVTILDKNDTYAALEEGMLSSNQQIILTSNKTISDGDRVRKEKSESVNEEDN